MAIRKNSPIGHRYGRLEIIATPPRKQHSGGRRVTVRCDCGTEKTVTTAGLYSGRVKSCGCLNRERQAERVAAAADARDPRAIIRDLLNALDCDLGVDESAALEARARAFLGESN